MAAVVERFGACSASLTGLIKLLTGDQERDALRDEEYTFSTSSKTTHVASQLTFAAVLADAAMVARVLEAEGGNERASGWAHMGAPTHTVYAPTPTQRDIEGVGGRLYYEASF